MKIWLNLIWKEWHEQKWKLLALTVIALSVCVAMLSQDIHNAEFALVSTMWAFVMFAPTFVAMGVSAGEHASGVIRFVRAQPVPVWKVATVRCLAGLCLLITPILCSSLLCWLAAFAWPQRGPYSVRTASLTGLPDEWTFSLKLVVLTGIGLAACVNLYSWIVAITVNQRTEFRVGLIGLLVTVVLFFLGSVGLDGQESSRLRLPSLHAGPMVWLSVIDFIRNSRDGLAVLAVVWQWVLTLGLMAVMVRQYGREEKWLRGGRREKLRSASAEYACLFPPMSSRWRALLWLQLRQTIPVCITALAIVFVFILVAPVYAGRAVDVHPIIGCVLAILIGVGSYVSELDPKLHTFWRSRPISATSWFWFKYVGGLVALIGLFDLPYALLVWTRMVPSSSPGIAACFPMVLHLLCYSLAVLAACSVRHSSYSTVLAVSALLAILLPELADFRIPQYLSFFELWEKASRFEVAYRHNWGAMSFLLTAGALVGAIALPVTATAAYLIKRDISVAP